MRRFGGSLLIALTLGMAALVAQSGGSRSASAKPYTTWTAYQGGSHSSQYSALDQINKSNVSRLEVAWTYPVNGNVTFNPIVVDNVMYVQGTGNAIVASANRVFGIMVRCLLILRACMLTRARRPSSPFTRTSQPRCPSTCRARCLSYLASSRSCCRSSHAERHLSDIKKCT